MKKNLIDLFFTLVKENTISDIESKNYPSTKSQSDFINNILLKECENFGLENIKITKNAYITGEIPSNIEKEVPTIGFLAHIDTSPDFSGENVNPKVIENYNGENITLENGLITSTEDFPYLKNLKEKTLIVTDGKTLLGADDKAGITEILLAIKYLKDNPEILHGKIVIAFTPDEEIGKGMDGFDVESFGADFAYTLDGGELGELECESFNAARAVIKIKGKSVHPGTAKNIMVNSLLVGNEIVSEFPKNETPSTTENYEGFYHIGDFNGDISNTIIDIIIRDFDIENFENRKNFVIDLIEKYNSKYNNIIELEIYDQYYNMGDIIKQNPHVFDLAKNAMEELNIKPIIKPIRGGTDGSKLSFMGLPCPNIFAGGYNAHGPYELAVVEDMEKAVEVIVKIVELNAK